MVLLSRWSKKGGDIKVTEDKDLRIMAVKLALETTRNTNETFTLEEVIEKAKNIYAFLNSEEENDK